MQHKTSGSRSRCQYQQHQGHATSVGFVQSSSQDFVLSMTDNALSKEHVLSHKQQMPSSCCCTTATTGIQRTPGRTSQPDLAITTISPTVLLRSEFHQMAMPPAMKDLLFLSRSHPPTVGTRP